MDGEDVDLGTVDDESGLMNDDVVVKLEKMNIHGRLPSNRIHMPHPNWIMSIAGEWLRISRFEEFNMSLTV